MSCSLCSENGGHFKPKYGGHFDRFFHIGSTIGKSGISMFELTSNQQINAILPNKSFNVDFLYYKLDFISDKIKAKASEQAVPMINKNEFSKIEISVPISIKEQQLIATILSDMDAEIEHLEKKLNKARQLKQGVMQQLLTGKIRLLNK